MPPNLTFNDYDRDDLGLGELDAMVRTRRLPVEPFTFASKDIVFATAVKTPTTFTVDDDAHFVMSHLGASATATAGTGTAYETFNVAIKNLASGRDLQSDDVFGATLFGTIGLPYRFPTRYLFHRRRQFAVIIQNLVGGANTIRFSVIGYKVYPARY